MYNGINTRGHDSSMTGYISVAEFQEACTLLSQHTKTQLSVKEIEKMGHNIDLNNDGYIDFNEFLEAFRIVDKFGRELERRRSVEQERAQAAKLKHRSSDADIQEDAQL